MNIADGLKGEKNQRKYLLKIGMVSSEESVGVSMAQGQMSGGGAGWRKTEKTGALRVFRRAPVCLWYSYYSVV